MPGEVSHTAIMEMLLSLRGASGPARYYPEIASAFERAASMDPVLPEPHGPAFTVCLLVADAWASSGMEPYSRCGSRMGLFQIRPPLEPRLPPGALLSPHTAALIAVDLMRTSVAHCRTLPWNERLAWYKDLGNVNGPALPNRPPSRQAREASRRILDHTKHLFTRRFGASDFSLQTSGTGA